MACPNDLKPFAIESFYRHQSLATELAQFANKPYKLEEVRRLMMCFNENDHHELDAVANEFNEMFGFKATWIDQSQIKKIDDRIASNIPSALLLEGNLSLDSFAYNQALIEGAKHYGATLFPSTVLGVSENNQGYLVNTQHGDIETDVLVLATGSLVHQYHQWLGIDITVQSVKGEMLRLKLKDKNITHDLTHGLISLYRRGEDELWLGVTREIMVSDELPTDAGKETLLHGAESIFPAIKQAVLIEHLASIRPMTPSGLPIVDKVPGFNNIFIANGGGIKGVLTSAGVGLAINDLLLNGVTSLPIQDFRLARSI